MVCTCQFIGDSLVLFELDQIHAAEEENFWIHSRDRSAEKDRTVSATVLELLEDYFLSYRPGFTKSHKLVQDETFFIGSYDGPLVKNSPVQL